MYWAAWGLEFCHALGGLGPGVLPCTGPGAWSSAMYWAAVVGAETSYPAGGGLAWGAGPHPENKSHIK